MEKNFLLYNYLADSVNFKNSDICRDVARNVSTSLMIQQFLDLIQPQQGLMRNNGHICRHT